MIINSVELTQALAGGALIGLASGLLILGLGRIAGISGISGRLLSGRAVEGWQVWFLLGLVAVAPLLWWLVNGVPEILQQRPWPLLIVAGLLVGVGTRMGSGCTSGHGICGLSRGSGRSLAAVATFMVMGVVTATLTQHWLGG